MKRSDLEKDAELVLESIRDRDYDIPRNRQIMKVIFGRLKYVYVLQLLFIILDCLLYQDGVGYQVYKVFYLGLLSMATVLIFSLVFIGVTYNTVCMYLILGDDVKRESVLLNVIEGKVRFYSWLLFCLNAAIGVILLYSGSYFIAGLGFSWFITFLMSILFLQGSLSRYMTPAVVSSFSKIRELISGGTVKAEGE